MEIVDHKKRIENIAENGYEFHFEKYFTEGWGLFRSNMTPFIIYALIVVAISIGMALIPIIGQVAAFFVGPALSAGYYVGCKKLDDTGSLEVGDFFKSFDFIVQLFLVALVGGALTIVGFVLLILPGIWFAVAIIFAYPLVVLARLEFWDAIMCSIKLVNRKWFNFLGLLIVLLFMNLLGVILLGVGLLFTVPITYCVLYAAFRDIVGFDGEREMDITEHLVDNQL